MSPRRIALAVALLAGLGYLGLSYLSFEMPQTTVAAEDCGFLPDEFVGAGKLTYGGRQAWWIRFRHDEEVFSLPPVVTTLGFVGLAVAAARHRRRT